MSVPKPSSRPGLESIPGPESISGQLPEPLTENFVLPLLNWYAQHRRSLPWRVQGPASASPTQNIQISEFSERMGEVKNGRGTPDSYRVWVSEIMLQQTRVETVIPYYERWMARFPTIATLAAASQQEVLGVWEGLGYYSRARCLHRAAQIVAADYAGQLPGDIGSLRKLPGIGPYTAGAIASIAFGLDQPALDGNIRRVLARLFDVTDDPRSSAGLHRLWELAAQHLPPGRAGDYNQALMDLGAVICTPRAPDCPHCPLAEYCQARALGVQDQRPVTRPRPAIPHYTVTAAVIARTNYRASTSSSKLAEGSIAQSPDHLRDGPLYLITQRPADGLLGGMWEFPGGKVQAGEDLPACLRREICEELGAEIEVGEPLGVYRHAFTHFRITLHAFRCTLIRNEPRPIQAADIRWVRPEEMASYPMGKVDRQIAKELVKLT